MVKSSDNISQLPNEWFNETFDSVDWTSLGIALLKQTLPDRARLVKFVYDWLRTQNNLKRWNESTTSKYPLFERRNETQCHVLHCKHPNRQSKYKLQLLQAKHHLPSPHIIPLLWDIFTEHLACSLGYGPEPTTNVPLTNQYFLKLSTSILENGYIIWPNSTKSFLSPMWGNCNMIIIANNILTQMTAQST